MALEDLLAEYQARGLSREEARRAVIAELQGMTPTTPLPTLRRGVPRLTRFAERAPLRPPASPVEVVERIAEALPQPPGSPPVGGHFAKVAPGGRIEAMGWRPPAITPVGFHRGYWIEETGDFLMLYRSGQAVNQWDASNVEERRRATTEVVAFVKRWPIQAERSVFTGGR